MTIDVLAMLSGSITSLLFSYIPKLNTWFAALSGEVKRLFMAGILAGTAALLFGVGCLGWSDVFEVNAVTCDMNGGLQMVKLFLLALVANQSTFTITPLPQSVRLAGASK